MIEPQAVQPFKISAGDRQFDVLPCSSSVRVDRLKPMLGKLARETLRAKPNDRERHAGKADAV